MANCSLKGCYACIDGYKVLKCVGKFNNIDWLCGPHPNVFHPTLIYFRLCSKPFLHLMEFLLTNSSSFLLARFVQVGANENNLSHLLTEKEP